VTFGDEPADVLEVDPDPRCVRRQVHRVNEDRDRTAEHLNDGSVVAQVSRCLDAGLDEERRHGPPQPPAPHRRRHRDRAGGLPPRTPRPRRFSPQPGSAPRPSRLDPATTFMPQASPVACTRGRVGPTGWPAWTSWSGQARW